MHAASFAEAVKVPETQSAQVRSRVVVPWTLTYLPAMHVCQPAQTMALSVVLKVPLAHALQARLTVAEPGVLTYVPAEQLVQVTHGLAGF